MNNILSLVQASPAAQLAQNEHFLNYARPLTSKLLESMELSKHLRHGEGDYLYYQQGEKLQKVLDLTGGYSANLLGHRNPSLLAKVEDWCKNGSPSLTQGSIRLESGKLARLISDVLTSETSERPWVTTFSNSGTEAIEAAIKHCLIYYRHKLQLQDQLISKELNLSQMQFNKLTAENKKLQLAKLRANLLKILPSLQMSDSRKDFIFHQVANVHEMSELISLLREINKLQIAQTPLFLSLEKAYHGKTMGALALTSSESFREPSFLGNEYNSQTKFINPYLDPALLDALINSLKQDLLLISTVGQELMINSHKFSLIAGSFIEPIQGEAGVKTVPESFLALMKKYSLQENFLMVFDEIQAGIGC